MKKLLGILVLGLFVSGCGTGLTNTTASNMDKGAAKIGMTKEEFCFEFNTLKFKQDPCKAPIFSSLSETLGLYYPDTKMEIAHDSRAEVFFVFENVNTPINRVKVTDGDGTLVKIFYNFEEAKKFASGATFSIEKDKVQMAKQACSDLGFEAGTEEFAECSLKKLKEQSQ